MKSTYSIDYTPRNFLKKTSTLLGKDSNLQSIIQKLSLIVPIHITWDSSLNSLLRRENSFSAVTLKFLPLISTESTKIVHFVWAKTLSLNARDAIFTHIVMKSVERMIRCGMRKNAARTSKISILKFGCFFELKPWCDQLVKSQTKT